MSGRGGPVCEELRRLNLLRRYLGTTAGYLQSRAVGQNFILGGEFFSVVDFF